MFFYPAFASNSSDRPFALLREVFRELATDRRARRARRAREARIRRELSTYNDRELADLGISRADIDSIARSAA